MTPREIPVESLLDTPTGKDEIGTPDGEIERCEDCNSLYRRGGWHQCVEQRREVPA